MQRYGQKSQDAVEDAMHRRKEGTLRSGRSRRKVTSRKQAIAIGLSEARAKGAKVPARPKSEGGSEGGSSSASRRKRSSAARSSSRSRSSSARSRSARSRTSGRRSAKRK